MEALTKTGSLIVGKARTRMQSCALQSLMQARENSWVAEDPEGRPAVWLVDHSLRFQLAGALAHIRPVLFPVAYKGLTVHGFTVTLVSADEEHYCCILTHSFHTSPLTQVL